VNGRRLTALSAFNLLPFTEHVETVALFTPMAVGPRCW
jgi:hypothetical protein